MKRTKKNNKGFSLVELIVVVLIMAIIAVALAPQVMKWVNESRKSADASTYDTVVAAAQDALADEAAWNACANTTFKITISKTGCVVDATAPTDFNDSFQKHLGGDKAVKAIKMKQSDVTAEVTVDKGTVVRTKEPGDTNTGTNTGTN